MDTSNDLKAFNKLFLDYQERFIRFANSYVSDRAAAEDFTLEAMMCYWENRINLPADCNVPAYILTIIKHKCINYLQHLQVRESASEDIRSMSMWASDMRLATLEECNPKELFSSEAKDIIKKALAELPVQSRTIFMRSRFQNATYKEIGVEFGITTKGVEYHIAKVTKLLRERLKDYIFMILFF